MLAESEAGVWHRAHSGHPNRSDSVFKIPTPCKTPNRANNGGLPAPVAHLARSTVPNRSVGRVSVAFFYKESKLFTYGY